MKIVEEIPLTEKDVREILDVDLEGGMLFGRLATEPIEWEPNELAFANEHLERWKHILKLRDWDIAIKISRMDEMPSNNARASCHIQRTRRFAVIYLMVTDDWHKIAENDVDTLDHEVDLVHELLHLVLAITSEDFKGKHKDFGSFSLEKGIESLSTALVNMDREIRTLTYEKHDGEE